MLLFIATFLTPNVTNSLLFAQSSQPPGVIVSEVREQEWYDPLEALGTLRANETVVLTASVTDTITNIHFEDGQRVERGYLLAEMTGEEESALVNEMTARRAEAKKQFQRLKDLPDSGAVSESLYDQRQREYQAAEAQLEAVKSRLKDRLIFAPFQGRIGLRNISVGALVEPGDEVATLTDDSIMKLDFSVPSVFLNALKEGLPVDATTVAYPEKTFHGQVSGIDSTVDPLTRSMLVRARIPNEDGLLKPGLLMNVVLHYKQRRALIIPEEAIVPSGADNFVFTVDRGEQQVAKKKLVTIGSRKKGYVEVVAGLLEGELVITHGTLIVRPDQPVTIQSVQQAGQGIKEIIANRDEKE